MNQQQNPPLVNQLDHSGSTDMISWRRQFFTLLIVFVLSTAYAVVRYNFFGDVSVENIPLYILNKSISMSAVVFLLMASWHFARGDRAGSKFWGAISLHFAMVHIAMSVVMLSESYYPRFYNVGKMNLNGEVSMLFGVLAGYCYYRLSTGGGRHLFLLIKCLAVTAICVHLFFMGYVNWFNTGKWLGQLPPISLISFLIGVVALVIYLRLLFRGRRTG